jgi:hypothetical protein
MDAKRLIVRFLDASDRVVDAVAYRPAVVKATKPLPRWWRCELAKLATRLDQRWGADALGGDGRPGPVCDCCGRRAAWLQAGGYADDPEFEGETFASDEYMAHRSVNLCSWCSLPDEAAITDETSLQQALAQSRAASVAWRWGR